MRILLEARHHDGSSPGPPPEIHPDYRRLHPPERRKVCSAKSCTRLGCMYPDFVDVHPHISNALRLCGVSLFFFFFFFLIFFFFSLFRLSSPPVAQMALFLAVPSWIIWSRAMFGHLTRRSKVIKVGMSKLQPLSKFKHLEMVLDGRKRKKKSGRHAYRLTTTMLVTADIPSLPDTNLYFSFASPTLGDHSRPDGNLFVGPYRCSDLSRIPCFRLAGYDWSRCCSTYSK